MKLLAWNIRAGGGTRLAALCEAIARHDADVLVLSEYHAGPAGTRLRAALAELGHVSLSRTEPLPGRKGVLVAARRRVRDLGPVSATVNEPYRLVGVRIGRLHLFAVYMPNLLAKVPYWEALLTAMAPLRRGHVLAIGDFNTCRAYVDEAGKSDRTGHFMGRVDAIGFVDLWRQRYPDRLEFSWFSHRGNGFRIDHAFFSPPLARRAGAITYAHTDRAIGLSDHAPLVVELDA